MSTPLLSPKRFANLRRSLIHHGTNEHSGRSCSTLNGELFRAFGIDPFGRAFEPLKMRPVASNASAAAEQLREKIEATVFDWQRLNYNAHLVRYAEMYEETPNIPGSVSEKRPEAPSPRLPKGDLLNAPALLKALKALRYNCDGGVASGSSVQSSIETLATLIDVLMEHCVEMLPEYQAAEWAI